MSSTGQWEVVTGKSAKNRNSSDASNKLSKSQKKKLIENMPRLEELTPIKGTHTLFDAFLEKEERSPYEKKENRPVINGMGDFKQKNKPAQQQKKKPQDPKKKNNIKPSNIEQAVATINSDDLQDILNNRQARFPTSPSLWLKDLASFLNDKLNVDGSNGSFQGLPFDYPLNIFPNSIVEILVIALEQCSVDLLHLFFEHCMTSMINGISKSTNTWGFKVFLQCLAQTHPEIVVSNLHKYVNLKNSFQNRANICSAILWATGQSGIPSLESGIKVWLELMVPLLGFRAYSKFCIDYLEQLLSLHADKYTYQDAIKVEEFFPVFDFIFANNGLAAPLQNQLLGLYPTLRTISYGASPSSTMHTFFPSYLHRLKPNMNPILKEEVLHNLIECLNVDAHCYSVWRQLYVKNAVPSSILLQHILLKWNDLPRNFLNKTMRETIKSFHVTNEELMVEGKSNPDGLSDCANVCQELLKKMTQWKFPWKHAFAALFILITSLLVYDIQIHGGSFQKSKTGAVLKQMGLLGVCQQAWNKIHLYSLKTYRLLEKHVPIYYSQVCAVVGPYVELFWAKFFLLAGYIWDSLYGVREFVNTNAPPLLEKFSELLFQYSTVIAGILSQTMQFLSTNLGWLWRFLSHYVNIASAWLVENVLTGPLAPAKLQGYAITVLEKVHHFTTGAIYWVSEQLTTLAIRT